MDKAFLARMARDWGPGIGLMQAFLRPDPRSHLLGLFHPQPGDGFIEITVTAHPADGSYDYSKLYYACEPRQGFAEDRVICFKLRHRGRAETLRLLLPAPARQTGHLRLRLDALPYTPGRVTVQAARLLPASEAGELSRLAHLSALKEQVRRAVQISEANRRVALPHLPESISLELTAGCNLTCSHCSSHGAADAHDANNRKAAFDGDMLERLAQEAFPALTLLNLVGRGEPMMVGKPLWQRMVRLLEEYRVLLTCVTNGYFIRQRLDAATLAVLHTLTVSIDGMTQDVFGANRGGASLALVLNNIAHFQDMRNASDLMRRPRLGLSWTLKKNNIRQFPDFIRLARDLEADLLYVRHLFVFRDADRAQSLLDEPDLVNRYLDEAYALLEGSRIKLDVAPMSAPA
ncbi:4Fe-4S cluster-binding domain-containing protein [Fertoebacter nigrum]|uniref:4Fe-4S cluster-binding domain-containing protein n=1 Tax=Fertoeibacter niger TaxID=2656921 RepID=A0A8X8KMQ1_9RHOB|nr:radical SAM protein [Fertoeibacter niger]NUB44150.1 4Fe-4S cluster-binding domain-containing protein [Fertoeibacter niger]